MSRKRGGKPGNQNANVIHGGAGAVRRIREGKPFVGLAAEAEKAVYGELEMEGRYALVIRNAVRLQAAADLYWNAVVTAAQDRSLEALDRYIKCFGWLAGCALRAWATAKKERPAGGGGVLDYEAVLAAKRAGEGKEDASDLER